MKAIIGTLLLLLVAEVADAQRVPTPPDYEETLRRMIHDMKNDATNNPPPPTVPRAPDPRRLQREVDWLDQDVNRLKRLERERGF